MDHDQSAPSFRGRQGPQKRPACGRADRAGDRALTITGRPAGTLIVIIGRHVARWLPRAYAWMAATRQD